MVKRRSAAPGSGRHTVEPSRGFDGNRIDLLVDGQRAFPAMLDGIGRARQCVELESYTFAPDATGRRFRDALATKAGEGVAVRLCVDGVGSLGTDSAFFDPLVRAGGRVEVYHPPKPWLPRWGLWKRNHRKLLVIDGAEAFLGGLNIADDYAPIAWGGGAWHDNHARIVGPAAAQVAKIARRTWRKLTGDHRALAAPAAPMSAGGVRVQVLESRLGQRFPIRRAYLRAIRQAKDRIRITNAYFIPDRGVRRALRAARRRGVLVQLLLAGRTDVLAVKYASRALYKRLLDWGVEIYEWTERVLHAKSAVIDGRWCSIGSYNLDRRSLLHNLEANVACVDEGLGREMDRQFELDLLRSERIAPQTWHRRRPLEKILEQLFFKLRFVL